MPEINKPNKRTFWRIFNANASVVHEGFTEIDQVTTTGQPNLTSGTNAGTVYPPLPNSGILNQGEIYSFEGDMVEVVQTHERTIYDPSDTPALFKIYRQNTEGLPWIENEDVLAGDQRIFNSVNYKCLQGHRTQLNFAPNIAPALWAVVQQNIPVWVQPTGAHNAYNIGDKVHFPTANDPIYESVINANVWSPIAYPQGWVLD